VGLLGSAFPLSFSQTQAPLDQLGVEISRGAVGDNPTGKRRWQWVMITALVTVSSQGLSRTTGAALELLGHTFRGIMISERFSACNHLPSQQRQLCQAHIQTIGAKKSQIITVAF
jgi:transposase